MVFFFKQKTAYEMRISDWSSDVCSSDLIAISFPPGTTEAQTASRVEAFNAATRRGGCGTAEAVAQKFDAEVVANDSLRLGELPEQLQEIVGRLQVGEATPPDRKSTRLNSSH